MTPKYPWSVETAQSRLALLFERIEQRAPELEHVFTEIFQTQADDQAKQIRNRSPGPLSGALISVKDLFDIRGSVTRAGSHMFDAQAPAAEDAEAITLLKQAGAIVVGKTNMTELAYSGLGLNPHYGTADNPALPGHIPGGSSSGGAVSVAAHAVDIAIGTDTGGSVRIPAAFTGLVGFKPSQNSVSRTGCRDLSTSLDSIGPMANCVDHCELAWRSMSGNIDPAGMTGVPQVIVPENFGLDQLDGEVEAGFRKLLNRLDGLGWKIQQRKFEFLQRYKQLPLWHFSSVESRCIYAEQYAKHPELIDPRVRSRMARADEISAIEYCQTLRMRESLIRAAHRELGSAFLLLPSVAILPPAFDALEDDDEYYRLNLLALRNTSLANVIDGCSITLPFRHGGHILGAMLTATGGQDLPLLALARNLEYRIAESGMAATA